ncbi:MAG: ABC transporter ATP-binding protein [Deltaproteobacteria bacterium]|nr:ABC transporter ATP-binding protein [Deltaproteobacteria bacterium]
MLEVKDLWVHYDRIEAVKGVSLQVKEGSTVAFVGANGAGKTTILRTISGLKSPTSGEIRFNGRPIERKDAADIVKLGIAHCPEGRRVFPFMTVLENLQMGAFIRTDEAGIRNDLDHIYTTFPKLKERSKQKAGTLSGGEQQMLAIARALLSKPKLLLLDEPSLGLAPIMVQQVAHIIAEIRQMGIGILLVEQNSVMALRLADYAYVLETGNVFMEGIASELLCNPKVKEAYLGG